MDLRNLPQNLDPIQRCDHRRQEIEKETGLSLDAVAANAKTLGHSEEKNCEQMFGQIPLPVGYAGPLHMRFSSDETASIHIPLATTEGALVASVNRGCKALSQSQPMTVNSTYHGMTRSLAFRCEDHDAFIAFLNKNCDQIKQLAEATSGHLKLLKQEIETQGDHVFVTIHCYTDEAMGMNMTTIAAQTIGNWIAEEYKEALFITVAGNVDSDKKPSKRTKKQGRGYDVTIEATIPEEIIATTLKSSPEAMVKVAEAKLKDGSKLAGALGSNLHAANIIAAVYLATGQDAAHTVEGSLTDTHVTMKKNDIHISVRLPAILVGIRGGGTTLPAQKQCLDLLLQPKTALHPCKQLAESIGAAVLAGELSLLAAQAGHELAKAHNTLGR